jgi:hypothetical protein
MAAATKSALEDLLRARRLEAEAPPLRGEDRRLRPLPTGVATIDALLFGGFPRGRLSEVFGPPSSGRTGLVLALLARSTQGGALAAFVDPADRLDPASAAIAGIDLARLLWLRGPRQGIETPSLLASATAFRCPGPKTLPEAVSAVGTLAGSGLFEVVVLDLAGVPESERRRLPGATWIRMQRMVEDSPTALVLLADGHVACGPGGVSLAFASTGPSWSGPSGPGRLLSGLGAQAAAGRHIPRRADFFLRTFV